MEYRLKEVFEFIRNGASIKQFDTSLGYPITRIETIANSYINIDKMGYAAIEELDKFEDYLLKDGDILMSHINSEKHLGKSAIYENINEDIIHGMNLLCLRPNKEVSYPKFLNYFFNSNKFRRQLPKITKKSVNQASFSVSDLKEVKIYLPNIDIQKNISKVLDKSQVLIYKRKTQIEYLDEIVKSRFIEMFGNPVVNTKGWDMKDLGTLGYFKNGMNYNQSDSGFNIKFLGVGGFKHGNVINNSNMLSTLELQEEPSEEYLLKNGDIVFVRSNGSKELVGRSVLIRELEEKTTYSGFCIRYRNQCEGLIPDFLIHLFSDENFKKSFKKDSRGANINNLNQQMLSSLKIIVPPLKLQNQFSTFVKQVDKLKFEAQKSLTEMENNFNSLMQRAFK